MTPRAAVEAAGSGDDEFASWDSTRLFYRWSHPARPRGVLACAHGILEHGESYGHLERAMIDAGFAFCIFDHRGHGRSQGRRGDVERFTDLVRDAEAFCRLVGERYAGLPLFLLGHSMGAVVAIGVALRCPELLNGVVVMGTPARPSSPNALVIALGRMVARVAPRLSVDAGVDFSELSHDPEAVEKARSDPLRLQGLTLRFGAELLRAIAALPETASKLTIPVLVLHGGEDPIADVGGARELHGWLGTQDKELIVFPGLFHELYNETPSAREKVFAPLIAWIESHLSAAGGGCHDDRETRTDEGLLRKR